MEKDLQNAAERAEALEAQEHLQRVEEEAEANPVHIVPSFLERLATKM